MSAQGSEEHAPEGSLEILECWHLSSDELSSLMRECLLPLAEQHASLGLAQSLQAEGIAASKAETNPGTQQSSVRSASYSLLPCNCKVAGNSVAQEHNVSGQLGRITGSWWAGSSQLQQSRDLHQRNNTAFQMQPHASMAC